MNTLKDDLIATLNRHSAENASGTPDFILAHFMLGCLRSYEETIQLRAEWYGQPISRPGVSVPSK